MPSFAVHSICGDKLIEKLRINEKDKQSFIIGNILPDISRVSGYSKLDDKEKRRATQYKKKISHFRTKKDYIIEYPDIDEFLEKYKEKVKDNIATLAYFFHLYTDYYYFKYCIPSVVEFLDQDLNKSDDRKKAIYARIIKSDRIINGKDFFNKEHEDGIYKEYSRCNKYLLDKYKIKIDCDKLFEYIDEYGFYTEIEETNSMFAYYAVIKLRKYFGETYTIEGNLKYFTEEQLDNLVNDIVNSFIEKYPDILGEYLK